MQFEQDNYWLLPLDFDAYQFLLHVFLIFQTKKDIRYKAKKSGPERGEDFS